MKKILFILGVIFSIYGFAEQEFSISETDTYKGLSEKLEFKERTPDTYSFKVNPYSIFGIRIDDQQIIVRTIEFDKDEKACAVLIAALGKSGYKIMVGRLEGIFPASLKPDEKKIDSYGFEDEKRIVVIGYSGVNDISTIVFKLKGTECAN